MPSAPPGSFLLPERYRVSGHIANGGMAGVYEATDEVLMREVAVKVLAPHLNGDHTARLRFQREARAAAGLSGHPHVVTIYDVGEYAGRSFIVMELMRRSVADVLRSGETVPVDKALRWLGEAASALDAAHEAGVVHRDVKPANMLLDDRERLAIADFGIARLAYENQLTDTGIVLGSSNYISPEQALGDPATPASDRYALAVVAFELLTGSRPFIAEHFAAQARAHIEDPAPAASSRRPELGPDVDQALRRGLAKDPAARWPSARALVEALAEGLAGGGAPAATAVLAPVPQRPQPAESPVSETPPGQPGATATWPAPRLRAGTSQDVPPRASHRKALWAAAAGLLAVLALTAWVIAAGGIGSDDQRAQESAAEETSSATPAEPAPPEPEPVPVEPEQPPEETGEAEPDGPATDHTTAARLNAEGFALFPSGRYEEALDPLERGYELCRDSERMNPCGFATFNYGAALNRSGDPEAAIPVLEERLERFGDNSRGDVAAELAAARSDDGERGDQGTTSN